MKFILDSEKELFLLCCWALPIIPQITVLLLLLANGNFSGILFTIMVCWFLFFGMICYFNHSVIVFEPREIILINRKQKYYFCYSDILRIEEISHCNNSQKLKTYRIHVRSNVPKLKLIKIKNRKIEDQFGALFPDIKVSKIYKLG